jgi:hypothetical protein
MLTKWVGVDQAEFDLPEPAAYRDLLAEIGRRYSQDMPPKLWNKKLNTFESAVVALDDSGQKIDDLNTLLQPGQKINFFLMALGG